MRRTSLILASAGGVAVLAVTGAALGVTAADRAVRAPSAALAAAAVDDSPTPDDGPSTVGVAPAGEGVDRDRAGAIALAAVGGGRVVDVEAEREHGRAVWSVEVLAGAAGWDVHVDRVTGGVLRVRQEAGDDRTAPDRRRADDAPGAHDRGGDAPGAADRHRDDATGTDDRGGDRRGGTDDGDDDRRHGGDDHGGDRHGDDD
ncbi:PepSY domain-containing protein [Micromonospora sp. NPDC050200]|uniref:PepSY domain-containing protein n=1 Tax=Micromonospora sp. NPDC050200 TaxID=3155664 RepID=UPI0033C609DD